MILLNNKSVIAYDTKYNEKSSILYFLILFYSVCINICAHVRIQNIPKSYR